MPVFQMNVATVTRTWSNSDCAPIRYPCLHYFTSIIAKQLIAKSMFSRIFRDKISAVPINCKHLIAKIMYFSNFWTDVYPPRIAPFWMIQYEFWSSWPDLSFELKFVFFDFFRSSSSKSSSSSSSSDLAKSHFELQAINCQNQFSEGSWNFTPQLLK